MISNLFTPPILAWFDEVKRPLPWRKNPTFYPVWISEIMLQQTRVDQMMAYYTRFMNAFPTLEILAAADEDEVLKNWEGLGYYSRARNLHYTAKQLVENQIIAENYTALLKLKGIGPYTAAAIASIVNNEAVVAIDGNVFRVFSRYFGLFDDIAASQTKKIFQNHGQKYIDKNRAGDFNQAVMELGALICTPKNPKCDQCPITSHCYAKNHENIAELPVKSNRKSLKNRYLNYYIINNHVLLRQRKQKDIWQNLYELPLIENINAEIKNSYLMDIPLNSSTLLYELCSKLTHQILYLKFWNVTMENVDFELFIKKNNYQSADFHYHTFALPRPLQKFFEQVSF